ncbi:MAG: AAA family ATPase [Muribaculaceae bacterium]|nr:AAA family ATPase [Muribaculaceae bacterium]
MTQLEFGFKNFRKYTSLNIKLGNTTYLVGENNSGKSTFVKGILLLLNNINIDIRNFNTAVPSFDFNDRNNISYNHINVPTFESALNKFSESKEISFCCRVSNITSDNYCDYTIEYCLGAFDRTDIKEGKIKLITIVDNLRGLVFSFDFENHITIVKQNEIDDPHIHNLHCLLLETELQLGLYESKGEIYNKLQIKKSIIQALVAQFKIKKLPEQTITVPMTFSKDAQGSIPSVMIHSLLSNEDVRKEIGRIYPPHKIKEQSNWINKCIEDISNLEYIYAKAADQRLLYLYQDRNDYMAEVVSEFNKNTAKNNNCLNLAKRWLEYFNIDPYIHTESIDGEAFRVYLSKTEPIHENRESMRPLASYGTGVIQLVTLIMNLVNLVCKYENKNVSPTIIIEEPEQNLHPKLQSRLDDTFQELSERYGFKFIIETHSEYIIRKTQVAVKQARYQSKEEMNALNPYKVLYFPQDGDPYEMQYRTDGRFSNSFGPGFYDEANSLIFEVL